MNAERVNAVAQAVLSDIEQSGIVSLVEQLVTALQNYIGTPQEASYQLQVSELRQRLRQAIINSELNSFPPSWTQVVEELGLADRLGMQLTTRIEEAFQQSEVTPAAVKPTLDATLADLRSLIETLKSLIAGMEALNIGAEKLEPGGCEITILIPRSAVNEEGLKALGAEFQELEQLLLPFSELATGSRPSFRVRTISSTDFTVFLDSAPATCACIAVAIERVLGLYKNYLEIRKLKSELQAQKVPASALKDLKTHVNTLMANGIAGLAEDLLNEFGGNLEPSRRNELAAELRARLNAIANRIDKGYNIDVRAEPPIDDAVTDDDRAETERILAKIRNASPQLKFIALQGEPLLSLSEDAEATVGPKVRRTKPRGKRISKMDPEA